LKKKKKKKKVHQIKWYIYNINYLLSIIFFLIMNKIIVIKMYKHFKNI